MVDGEGEAEQVDQDPQQVEHIVAVWTLIMRIIIMIVIIIILTCTMGQEGSWTWSSRFAAKAPLRKVGPRLIVMLANLWIKMVNMNKMNKMINISKMNENMIRNMVLLITHVVANSKSKMSKPLFQRFCTMGGGGEGVFFLQQKYLYLQVSPYHKHPKADTLTAVPGVTVIIVT